MSLNRDCYFCSVQQNPWCELLCACESEVLLRLSQNHCLKVFRCFPSLLPDRDHASVSSAPPNLGPLPPSGCAHVSGLMPQVFLVGDPVQLPATVISDRADKHGYSTSLFKRLQTSGFPVQVCVSPPTLHSSCRRAQCPHLLPNTSAVSKTAIWHHASVGVFRCWLLPDHSHVQAECCVSEGLLCRCWTRSTGCTRASHSFRQPPSMPATCATERAWRPAPPAHGMSTRCAPLLPPLPCPPCPGPRMPVPTACPGLTPPAWMYDPAVLDVAGVMTRCCSQSSG